jgi:hypothetical protein
MPQEFHIDMNNKKQSSSHKLLNKCILSDIKTYRKQTYTRVLSGLEQSNVA